MNTDFIIVVAAFANAWVLTTLIHQWRRARTERLQLEVQFLLLDQLGDSNDIARLVSTEDGRNLIRAIGLGPSDHAGLRILRSVQSGIVLLAAGATAIGAGDMVPAATPSLLLSGALMLALGAGFLIAAGVSYQIARRLDLLHAAKLH